MKQDRDELLKNLTSILTYEPPDDYEGDFSGGDLSVWHEDSREIFCANCYAYISTEMTFPFNAKVDKIGATRVQVIELSEDYDNGIHVGIPIKEDNVEDFLYVPLDEIEPLDADKRTTDAVDNWKCWANLPDFPAWWKY
jgi:hypothetical protein